MDWEQELKVGQGETQSQQLNLQGLMQHENPGLNSKIIVPKKKVIEHFERAKAGHYTRHRLYTHEVGPEERISTEALKEHRGGGSAYTAMRAPSCGFLHRESYTRTNSASRRTWSELKWNYRGSAGSTVRERLIPQEEWGWWVSRQQRHLREISSTPLAPPLSLWGQASSRHICTTWRHSWPKALE